MQNVHSRFQSSDRDRCEDRRVSWANAEVSDRNLHKENLLPLQSSDRLSLARMSVTEKRIGVTSYEDCSLPCLSSASSLTLTVEREYKSGASYQGQIKHNKKTGQGIFLWPNGAQYNGEFIDNDRHGQGVQDWSDGSSYAGEFSLNMRHGNGNHKWSNGESFVGTFFRDRRHGKGTYTWPDGSRYEGTFYMDRKEGYGKFYFPNGYTFEGLYGSDERYGPGVLKYNDGTADVGLWNREKLVRLCLTIPDTFSMLNHPNIPYFPEEHIKYIDKTMVCNRTDIVENIIHPPEQFNYPPENAEDLMERTQEQIFSDTLHHGSLAVEIQAFDKEFFADVIEAESETETNETEKEELEEQSEKVENSDKLVRAWNITPSSINMQKHVLRHECRSMTVSFNVQKILDGDRSEFPERGQIEIDSEEFMLAAQSGNLSSVIELLNSDRVYADVADMNGYTPLFGSAVNWHIPIINTLLDNGADINHLNNAGISAIAACHLSFYPVETFKYNIAERYLEKPADYVSEKCFDMSESLSSIRSPRSKKSLSMTTITRNQSNIDGKKIQMLRDEYSLASVKDDKVFSGKASEGEMKKSNLEPPRSPTKSETEDRTLGTLNIKRVSKINIEDMLIMHPDMNESLMKQLVLQRTKNDNPREPETFSEANMSEFGSTKSIHNLPIDVSDQLIERCATDMSHNEMVVSRPRMKEAMVKTLGTVRRLAMAMSQRELMEKVIQLLLRRGADPNASQAPMPVLFFAIKAADVNAVCLLLMKGASTSVILSEKLGSLTPLHIACCIPGEEGVQITELLLNSLANPNASTTVDDSFNTNMDDDWCKDVVNTYLDSLSGGRTPLHIACARDDNYSYANSVVHLLLDHHANPNLVCNGHSALALSVASGNDRAIEELLAYDADPCLPLSHGVGSVLCIASSTQYEHRRSPQARIHLIDKLVRAGADILAPIPIGPKRLVGTAVDYAYHMFNLDRRIAHMPYHALSTAEREVFNVRRKLLAHMADILRSKAQKKERQRYEEELETICSTSTHHMSAGDEPFLHGIIRGKGQKMDSIAMDGRVSFGKVPAIPTLDRMSSSKKKPLFRYCYDCGKSVGVRLTACTRCKKVFFCSKACKIKSWNVRHKEECVRIADSSRSPSPRNMKLPKIPNEYETSGVAITHDSLNYLAKVNGLQGPREDGLLVPVPPNRSMTYPGTDTPSKVHGRVKVQMKISIRSKPKNDSGLGKSLPDVCIPQLSEMVPQGRYQQRSGMKGKFPELSGKMSQNAHGVLRTRCALTLIPNLRGDINWNHYKYIYMDNYSFN